MLATLPSDVLNEVAAYVDVHDLLSFRLSCTAINSACNNWFHWKLRVAKKAEVNAFCGEIRVISAPHTEERVRDIQQALIQASFLDSSSNLRFVECGASVQQAYVTLYNPLCKQHCPAERSSVRDVLAGCTCCKFYIRPRSPIQTTLQIQNSVVADSVAGAAAPVRAVVGSAAYKAGITASLQFTQVTPAVRERRRQRLRAAAEACAKRYVESLTQLCNSTQFKGRGCSSAQHQLEMFEILHQSKLTGSGVLEKFRSWAEMEDLYLKISELQSPTNSPATSPTAQPPEEESRSFETCDTANGDTSLMALERLLVRATELACSLGPDTYTRLLLRLRLDRALYETRRVQRTAKHPHLCSVAA